jgi:pantoate--beta-alanine ligase
MACRMLQDAGVDALFLPKSLYEAGHVAPQGEQSMVVGSSPYAPGQHDTFVVPGRLQGRLCGISRPHFFKGVATVVAKLFNIVEPAVAVFGKKDYQQLRVIQTMVRDLDFDVRIVGGDIAREPDGLATSSRNARLSVVARTQAICIHAALMNAHDTLQDLVRAGTIVAETTIEQVLCRVQDSIVRGGGTVDYVQLVDAETLENVEMLQGQPAVLVTAAFFEGTGGFPVRLLDNMQI